MSAAPSGRRSFDEGDIFAQPRGTLSSLVLASTSIDPGEPDEPHEHFEPDDATGRKFELPLFRL